MTILHKKTELIEMDIKAVKLVCYVWGCSSVL